MYGTVSHGPRHLRLLPSPSLLKVNHVQEIIQHTSLKFMVGWCVRRERRGGVYLNEPRLELS